MKNRLSNLIVLFCLIAFAACSNEINPGFNQEDYEPIVPPEPVRTLTSMASGERVILSGTSVEDIVLSWIPTVVKGNTVFRYEVLFDTNDGDFSNPIEVLKSDKEALETKLTLSHFQMNAIGRLAKFKCNSNGTLRWKVRAYCGLDQSLSSLEGTFTIFMMDGIDDIPTEEDHLLITGTATEDGGDISKAQEMSRIDDGIYQVYLKMKKDKTYLFTCEKDGEQYIYYYSGGKLRQRLEGETYECVQNTDGIYRITLNFNTQEMETIEIKKLYLYCIAGSYSQEFSYLGYGKWGVKSFLAHKRKESWAAGGETRYHFRMETVTSEGNVRMNWGSNIKDGGSPKRDDNGNLDYSYFNMYEMSGDWDYSFRYDDTLLQWGEFKDNKWEATVRTDVTIYLNADYGVYTHRWVAVE
ncbi:SusE domain-containing protein [Dysgonomonas sp. BGC7]|uniref:SusE domain-containing protein n=1 Tax=Dysgonomonas sp. BGC7 TaxID=1658008 RepID=UPI00068184AA|nr:SusE domain-containing protein [Dysgonomonas sp. BGC7]MBD8387144.1 SusE domain-containing protein [Dysgonomonas sp. BGC7]